MKKRNGKNAKEITQPFYEVFFFLAMNIDLNKFFPCILLAKQLFLLLINQEKKMKKKTENSFWL